MLLPTEIGVVQVAQNNGFRIIKSDHISLLRFLFTIEETDFQAFFVNQSCLMTFCKWVYSLVRIPG